MKRILLLVVACGLGLAAGEFLTTNFVFRRSLGEIAGRGRLEAIVGRRGIYDRDLARTGRSLASLIDEAKLDAAAAGQPIRAGAIEHEMDLLRWPFGAARPWNPIERFVLRRELAANLRDRAWLESQLAARIPPNDEEVRNYYNAHPNVFVAPLGMRASHLFLAAPDGCPSEVMAAKRSLVDRLAARLAQGESFPELVAAFSEDEATKKRGGDLNYFAEARMLPAVFRAAQSLGEGQTSAPVRSRLGFHLIRQTEIQRARPLSFEEAQAEIATLLENQKRAAALPGLLASVEAYGSASAFK